MGGATGVDLRAISSGEPRHLCVWQSYVGGAIAWNLARSILDDYFPAHFLMTASTKVISQEFVFTGFARREAKFGNLSRRQVGTKIHVRNFEAIDEINRGKFQGFVALI